MPTEASDMLFAWGRETNRLPQIIIDNMGFGLVPYTRSHAFLIWGSSC
jgi:hypothetical protein